MVNEVLDLDALRPQRELGHQGTDMVGTGPPAFCDEQSRQGTG